MKEYRKILIVDDSATSRMIIQRCMEIAGLRASSFLQAENGLEAMAVLNATQEIDLIVTDLNMPKMDGRALARMLKGSPKWKSLELVVASSIADGDAEAELRALGVTAVLKKPISPAKIAAALGGNS
jgi:CheY-like chemotaxis protein